MALWLELEWNTLIHEVVGSSPVSSRHISAPQIKGLGDSASSIGQANQFQLSWTCTWGSSTEQTAGRPYTLAYWCYCWTKCLFWTFEVKRRKLELSVYELFGNGGRHGQVAAHDHTIIIITAIWQNSSRGGRGAASGNVAPVITKRRKKRCSAKSEKEGSVGRPAGWTDWHG